MLKFDKSLALQRDNHVILTLVSLRLPILLNMLIKCLATSLSDPSVVFGYRNSHLYFLVEPLHCVFSTSMTVVSSVQRLILWTNLDSSHEK